MTIRDKRWEKVYASMGRKQDFRSEEFDEGLNLLDWYEIKVEVWHDAMYYWRFELIHADDWPEFTDEMIAFILHEMIASIDERMAAHARGAEATPEEGAGEAR